MSDIVVSLMRSSMLREFGFEMHDWCSSKFRVRNLDRLPASCYCEASLTFTVSVVLIGNLWRRFKILDEFPAIVGRG